VQIGKTALAVAGVASLAAPGVATAAKRTVQIGPFGKKPAADFQAAFGDANQYFRKRVVIHKGDKVTWKNNGFHTVTHVPSGGAKTPLFVPDTDHPLVGVNDAAGNPFWFNGQARLVLNPTAAAPAGGKRFKAGEYMNSGVPLGSGPPAPYTLKFTRKGTFGFFCIVHPDMAMKVKVVKDSKEIPTKSENKKEAKREQKVALQRVQSLTTGIGTEELAKTIQAGNDKRSGATVYKFFPQNPTYKVGDVVTLQMSPGSTEVHTFSFGPTNGSDQYLDVLAAGNIAPDPADPSVFLFDARVAYPSEPPPAGVPSYNGGNHGNGFLNSGVLDQDDASPQGASSTVRFTQPGTYNMICLIHPFMTETVKVVPA
jgi:plastocyanin